MRGQSFQVSIKVPCIIFHVSFEFNSLIGLMTMHGLPKYGAEWRIVFHDRAHDTEERLSSEQG